MKFAPALIPDTRLFELYDIWAGCHRSLQAGATCPNIIQLKCFAVNEHLSDVCLFLFCRTQGSLSCVMFGQGGYRSLRAGHPCPNIIQLKCAAVQEHPQWNSESVRPRSYRAGLTQPACFCELCVYFAKPLGALPSKH